MDDSERPSPDHADETASDEGREPATRPLTMKGSFGTAVGAAMLGFEQALRREPPAETVAAEHMPERGHSGAEGGVIIEIPDPVDDE